MGEPETMAISGLNLASIWLFGGQIWFDLALFGFGFFKKLNKDGQRLGSFFRFAYFVFS